MRFNLKKGEIFSSFYQMKKGINYSRNKEENLLDGIITKESLGKLSENDFRKKVIIPLLKTIGAENVIDMHGRTEEGIDIYFEYPDVFEHKKRFGIQVKKGNLRYESRKRRGNVLTIVNQIKMGFSKEIKCINPEMGKSSFTIDGFYVIISGDTSSEAVDYILRERKSYPYIHIIDGNDLVKIINNKEILAERMRVITIMKGNREV